MLIPMGFHSSHMGSYVALTHAKLCVENSSCLKLDMTSELYEQQYHWLLFGFGTR